MSLCLVVLPFINIELPEEAIGGYQGEWLAGIGGVFVGAFGVFAGLFEIMTCPVVASPTDLPFSKAEHSFRPLHPVVVHFEPAPGP